MAGINFGTENVKIKYATAICINQIYSKSSFLNRSCTTLNDRVGANSLENPSAQIDVFVDNTESYIVEKYCVFLKYLLEATSLQQAIANLLLVTNVHSHIKKLTISPPSQM